MKLLIDAHCFDAPASEGVNTYLEGIYTQATALAPEIDFFFASRQGEGLKKVFGEGPNIHYLKLNRQSRAGRMLREYPELIQKLGIDKAHFQYFAPPFVGCKTVITMHDILFMDFPRYFPWDYRVLRRLVFGSSARKASTLATVSEYSRKRISRHFGIPEERIVLTPNAVKEDFFNVDREAARREIYGQGIRPFIMNVNRIEPRKNQLALVKAYVETGLDREGYDLVMINRPAIPVTELERYFSRLPEETRRRIHRIDGLPHEELIKWYGAASLFVYPSIAEGFGIPPLEALATGTPTICNNSTAMADYDFLGENLIDLSDESRLKERILANLRRPPSEEAMTLLAEEVKRRYNWRRSAQALLDSLSTTHHPLPTSERSSE